MPIRLSRQLLYDKNTLKLEVLTTPINRLGLKIKNTFLEQAIRRAREELIQVGISKLDPTFYLSDGYGCIEGTANISVGFYDCNSLLQELNNEWRGWWHDEATILHIVRHEIGHAFCYSYKLYRQPDFRELFRVEGHFFRTYPPHDRYRHNPWSRDYVNPSGDYYAQKHPDDDFAETFAVWLTPNSRWWKEYRYKPGALRKLEYVGQIVQELGRQETVIDNDPAMIYEHVDDIKVTVAEYLRARLTSYRKNATGYVDPDLRMLFRGRPRLPNPRRIKREYQHAERLLREQKRVLVNRVSYWVGVDDVVAADLIDKCAARARALDLWVKKDQHEKKLIEVTSYLSTLCVNYARTGQFFR